VTFNGTHQVLAAVLDSHGLAYLPGGLTRPYRESGHLVRVLEDWCPPWTGYRLYYSSGRQPSSALAVALEALSHRD
jgi:DNA-binding transcriptional LysR family regulator